MEIYFDNSATTKCLDEVIDVMNQVMKTDYGNPSSMHIKGVQAEQYIKTAKEQISKTLKVNAKELIFTSGGTESINFALIGTAYANVRRGKHLITTKIEHPAVLNTMAFLEEQGFCVTYLDVDKDGSIDFEELASKVTDETILVSMMHVNNEIGTVLPIPEAARIIKEKNPNTLLHVDAIQSYGKYAIYPKREGIDLLSVSGHKIHGPKGVGFLFVKEKTKIRPMMFGGGQQNNLRSGTENVPGAAGLGMACYHAYKNFLEDVGYLRQLKEKFCEEIKKMEDAHINGKTGTDGAPHIVSVSIDGVPSEVMLHALEDKGIYVSAGSACASNKTAVSNTLKQIGVSREHLTSTIRFSFSKFNTMEEISICIDAMKELIPMLKKYHRH